MGSGSRRCRDRCTCARRGCRDVDARPSSDLQSVAAMTEFIEVNDVCHQMLEGRIHRSLRATVHNLQNAFTPGCVSWGVRARSSAHGASSEAS